MGKLRTSITGLGTLVNGLQAKSKQVADKLEKEDSDIFQLMQRVEGGGDVLYQYVMAKLEKAGGKYSAHRSDKLAAHADANVQKFAKGIQDALRDLATRRGAAKNLHAGLGTDVARAEAALKDIEKQLASKKKKLFQSRKFKDKMALYERALGELNTSLAQIRKAVDNIRVPIKDSFFKEFVVTPDTTLKQLEDLATMSIQNGIKDMKKQVAADTWVKRRFRENGDLAQAHALLKKWSDDADDMELESSDAWEKRKRRIKNIVLFQGSTNVAKATAADFEPNKPLVINAIEWKKGFDPLSMLQQKITIKADYEDKSEGSFAYDLKLGKLGNGHKTGTFMLLR